LFLTVAVGKVLQIGSSVKGFKIGDAIVSTTYNAFGDYIVISSKQAIKVPSTSPQAIPIFVSGLTASIALEQAGRIKKGETVLVTAAAGATGLFAVQLAKLAGCHVIGTCSSDEKCDYLLSLGVDRAINYTKVDLYKTLKSEYPKGIDVVYESVGGETFNVLRRQLGSEREIDRDRVYFWLQGRIWLDKGSCLEDSPSSKTTWKVNISRWILLEQLYQ
jgi:NADPH-dependent curcumin reductase CurA